ncbi:hypothetical protein LCER1_G008680 [Lachnellula cervina]|uniref:Uncharacterized protein n=1 Tax=Lachnellula cervina TaxID=1316786 RepID=A0A7D8YQZ2_9HELO|nr:hypothetical protein LCER1_G008680 [Lachnellula cervina]
MRRNNCVRIRFFVRRKSKLPITSKTLTIVRRSQTYCNEVSNTVLWNLTIDTSLVTRGTISHLTNRNTKGIMIVNTIKGAITTGDNFLNPSEFEGMVPAPLDDKIITKQMTDLGKLYNDKLRYGGGRYDMINIKLTIFYENCKTANFPTHLYHRAFPYMLKDDAAAFFYQFLAGKHLNLPSLIKRIKSKFETKERQKRYVREWQTTTLETIGLETKNEAKDQLECLQILFTKLAMIQNGLPPNQQGMENLRDKVIEACRTMEELFALSYEWLYQIRWNQRQIGRSLQDSVSSISLKTGITRITLIEAIQEEADHVGTQQNQRQRPMANADLIRIDLWISHRGCWSITHTSDERKAAYAKFKEKTHDPNALKAKYNSFLAEMEGISGLNSDDDDAIYEGYMMDEEKDNPDSDGNDSGHTSLGSFFT